MNTYKKPWGGK
jgi:hypothetical protein